MTWFGSFGKTIRAMKPPRPQLHTPSAGVPLQSSPRNLGRRFHCPLLLVGCWSYRKVGFFRFCRSSRPNATIQAPYCFRSRKKGRKAPILTSVSLPPGNWEKNDLAPLTLRVNMFERAVLRRTFETGCNITLPGLAFWPSALKIWGFPAPAPAVQAVIRFRKKIHKSLGIKKLR